MRWLKLVTLWTVIMAAGTAVAAPVAAAVPEWMKGGATITRRYEFGTERKVERPTFVFGSTGEVVCTFDSSTTTGGRSWLGEIEAPNRVKAVKIGFYGCLGKGFRGGECRVNSRGAAAETVFTVALRGELVEVAATEAASGRGLRLVPETGRVFFELEGTCLPVSPTPVEGAVIGEIAPVKEEREKLTLNWAGSAGRQKIQNIRGSNIKETLEAFRAEAVLQAENYLEAKEGERANRIEVS